MPPVEKEEKPSELTVGILSHAPEILIGIMAEMRVE